MKPEIADLTDMDDKVYDPRALFAEICLLITEGRTPELSKKGRVEGPHCPPITGQSEHECDRHKEQCRKASDIIHQQDILWQNKIPMRIDVLLFPDCKHGLFESSVIEGVSVPSEENFELLERWDVQFVKKRSPERMEGFVKGRVHLQAVRSYLHFSQLSSWLISLGGALPLKTVYRIYAPGETVGPSFSRLPEIHNFPSADLGDVIMRTTCAYLPRQKNPMVLFCRSPSPTFEPCRRTKKVIDEDTVQETGAKKKYLKKEPVPSTSKYADEMDRKIEKQIKSRFNKMECDEDSDSQIMRKPPFCPRSKTEYCSKGKLEQSRPCPVSITPKRKVDQLSPTMHNVDKHASTTQKSTGLNKCDVAIATKPSVIQRAKSPISDKTAQILTDSIYPDHVTPTKSQHMQKPVSLCVNINSTFSSLKRLPSPKVLLTGSSKPEPSTFKKRCLDLEKPECIAETEKELENLTKMNSSDICDLIKPPSLGELEAYLSSLSNKTPRKQRIEDIPTTKCSFYLDDSEVNNEDETVGDELSTDIDECFKKPVELCQTQSLSKRKACKTKNVENKIESQNHVKSLFTDSKSDIPHENLKFSKEKKSQSEKVTKLTLNKTNQCDNCEEIIYTVKDVTVYSSKDKYTHHNKAKSEKHLENCNQDTSKIFNGSDQFASHTQSDLSRECDEITSPKKKALNELSIPCNIGAVDNAMTTLAQNLESMDIDDRPYSPFSRNSSPTLDNEVERHLSPKLGARMNDFGKGSDRTISPSSLNSSPEPCDTNSPTRGLSLCKQLLKKEFQQNVQKEITSSSQSMYKNLPSPDDIKNFQFMINRSASVIFNSNTGLPSRSSPAPIKRISSNKFDYDCSLTNVKAIKNAISCSKLTLQSEDNTDTIEDPKIISTSAPASTNCLLGNFEESVLNGRIEPVGVVDGFSVEIGAGGTFCPKHVTLPVAAYFFQLSDDNAPSPYLGHVNLEPLGKRGYHIPRTGTVQITLFNPNKTVVKMFVVMYDLSDMPANCQTFLRQRTLYMPVDPNSAQPTFLRYLIHLRFQSSKSGKIYLHTDIRLIFARDKFEFDPRVANYELRSFTEGPENPKFSPKK